MRTKLVTLVLALVLALAAPASAATWRGYGSVQADDTPSWTTLSGTANDVRDIQLGFYTFEGGFPLEVSWYHQCMTPTGKRLRSGEREVTTTAGAWTWLTVHDSDRLRDCEFYVFTRSEYGPHQVKVRVRS
jgi:hypothetical protein